MQYRSADLSRKISSRIWSALIAPRPVFLIVSCSEGGVYNIAPYSSVALVSVYPPIVSISFGSRGGEHKHTLANILSTKVFSLNSVPRALSEKANEAASGSEATEDFRRLALTPLTFTNSTAQRIAESPASISCELTQIVSIEGAISSLVLARCGEIVYQDEYSREDVFDPIEADLIASVGAEEYITVKGEAFTLPRTWE